mmetsp:Transcript_11287/g.20026  ORF Transcript_11287/g.20026 Transcript_11287/m.20026 type:complete len:476 (+) Transcript_11287:14-1441(+)
MMAVSCLPSVEILESCQKHGVHYYQIKVRDDAKDWIVERRYSDFVALDNQLSISGGLERQALPEKGVFGIRHMLNWHDFNQKRLDSLQDYLQHLLSQTKALSHHPPLATFLQPERSKRLNDPIHAKQALIIDAITGMDDLSNSTRELLCSVVSTSLGVAKDERHAFQSQAIAMVGQALATFETRMKEDIKKSRTRLAETVKQQHEKEAATAHAEKGVFGKATALASAKDALEKARNARVLGKKAWSEAEAAKKKCEADLERYEKLRIKLRNFENCGKKAGRLPSEEQFSSQHHGEEHSRSSMVQLGKEIGIDSAVLAAVQVVLNKAPSERTSFDALALKQWETEFAAALADVEKILADAEPKRAEHRSLVEKSQQTCDELEVQFKECSDAFSAAQTEHKNAQAATASAKSMLATAERIMLQAKQAQQVQTLRLADFQKGVLTAFQELGGSFDVPAAGLNSQPAPSEAPSNAEVSG